jgi:hypothetical protein
MSCLVAASALSALFFSRLLAPDNLLISFGRQMAIIESSRWAAVQRDLRSILASRSDLSRMQAASRALLAAEEMLVAGREVSDSTIDLDALIEADPHNAVTRACVAAIRLRHRLGVNIEIDGASRVYEEGWAEAWRRVLIAHGVREDFASRWSAKQAQDARLFVALPAIVAEWLRSAEMLESEGRSQAARDARRQAIRFARSLLDAPRTISALLLGSDLIVETVKSYFDDSNDVARRVVDWRDALRQDVHSITAAAPRDWTDPFFVTRVLSPRYYRRMSYPFIAALVFGFAMAGAVLSLILGLLVKIYQRKTAFPVSENTPRRRMALGLFFLLSAGFVTSALAGYQIVERENVTLAWVCLVALAAILVGCFSSALGWASSRSRAYFLGGLIMLCIVSPLIAPAWIARMEGGARRNPEIAGLLIVGFLLFIIVLVVYLRRARRRAIVPTRPTPARRLIWSSAVCWLMAAAGGLGCLVFHRAAERTYIAETVAGYQDEVAARLGDDWRTRHLDELDQLIGQ